MYKSFLWRVAECLSYIPDSRCLKVKHMHNFNNRIRSSATKLFVTDLCSFHKTICAKSEHGVPTHMACVTCEAASRSELPLIVALPGRAICQRG